MTGFGRGVTTTENFQLTIEVRSVNHRFLEIQTRFPKEWLEIELLVKKMLSQYVERGKLDVTVNLKLSEHASGAFQINWPSLQAYEKARTEIAKQYPIKKKWSMKELLMFDNIITYEKQDIEQEQLTKAIEEAIKVAGEKLLEMREKEGAQLKLALTQLISDLKKEVKTIRDNAEEAVKKYREKLFQRIQEIAEIDTLEERVLAEVGIFAEKVDITEELDRLESHFKQFEETLEESKTIGRKLDFLMQEMFREMNTIGSKNQSAKISVAVVQAKTIIEKMREQVQNIE